MGTEDKPVAAEGATEEKNEPQTPEYATKADLQNIADMIAGLKAELGGKDEELDPTDQETVNKLYAQLAGSQEPTGQGAAEPSDPTTQRLERIEKAQAQMLAVLDTQYRAVKRAEIDEEFGAKYEDWMPHKKEIWALAKQHPTLDGDQVYVLWKLGKHGPEGLSKKEQATAKEAAKVVEEAKAAGSEKPGASSAGKIRETSSLGELLRETWDSMPAKPVFK